MKLLKIIAVHLLFLSSMSFLIPRLFNAPNSLAAELYLAGVILSAIGYFAIWGWIK